MSQVSAVDQKDTYVIGQHPAQLAWANGVLAKGIVGQWQPVRAVPWSTVSSVQTRQGRIILKSMARPFAGEAIILTFLEEHASGCITHLVAANNHLQCFLMHDAGKPLRDLLSSHFSIDPLLRVVEMCADVQIAMIPHVDKLIRLGVNDWRLDKIPSLYQQFIKDRGDVLVKDGLLPDELDDWNRLVFSISDACLKLSICDVPETLEHGDFHDNNILVDGHKLVISDWGDASITHPFFSCVSLLDSARRHHPITPEDEERLIQTYLKKWQKYGSARNLRIAYECACKLYYVILAMSHVRFYDCPNAERFPEYKGFSVSALRKLKKSMRSQSKL